jgi:hypothetical protein
MMVPTVIVVKILGKQSKNINNLPIDDDRA